ncbi:hypothetical protein RDWZM_004287 [Blomia tropicalis]|uniref:H15 domain-containing protein n=1 Tax=Blomia tropicalis TaxID=40697 RepID=A0A9Q0MHD4_BLOTA|nr:hypothetical protein RDWZM_004287 [Blomia tropicalis]
MAEIESTVKLSSAKTKTKKSQSKTSTAKTTKPKVPSTHPPVKEMVTETIKTLKERNGSSLAAIKKHIASNYEVDIDRIVPFIRRFLKSAVTSGLLVQVKGKGATGSFKMSKPVKEVKEKPKKLVVADEKKKEPKPKSGKPKKVKASEAVKKSPSKKKSNTVKTSKVKNDGVKTSPVKVKESKPVKSPKKKIVKKVAKAGKSPKKTVPKKITAK